MLPNLFRFFTYGHLLLRSDDVNPSILAFCGQNDPTVGSTLSSHDVCLEKLYKPFEFHKLLVKIFWWVSLWSA